MLETDSTVFLLDDEQSVVVALARLLQTNGFAVHTWTSAEAFLDEHDAEAPGCLVADVRMPGMSGLQLQHALLARGIERPIVFITGQGDMPTAVQAMKAGAVTFLCKPVGGVELVTAVREALSRDAASRVHHCERRDILR